MNNVQEEREASIMDSESESEWYDNKHVVANKAKSCHKIKIEPQFLGVEVEGRAIKMEIDGGSEISLINELECNKLFPNKKIEKTNIKLIYFGGEKGNPIGVIRNVRVEYGRVTTEGELYVVGKYGQPLIGRNWLNKLQLWPLGISQTNRTNNRVQERTNTNESTAEENRNLGNIKENFLAKYRHLFSPGLGTYNRAEFAIRMKKNTTPVYYKPRTLPFAIRDKVEAEIERLVKEGALSQVEVGEWGTPVVPILKKDGTLRLCGDYKITVNKTMLIDRHPLSRIEQLIANLQGAKYFSKIDLKEAYAQVPLSADSKQYLTLSTHKGLYQPNTLPYGIASAPGFFQRQIKQILAGMPNVNVFLDDIIIKGKTIKEI